MTFTVHLVRIADDYRMNPTTVTLAQLETYISRTVAQGVYQITHIIPD